jgi:hypothetical protein
LDNHFGINTHINIYGTPAIIPSGKIHIRHKNGKYSSLIDNDSVPEISVCADANPNYRFCQAYDGKFQKYNNLRMLIMQS